MPSKDSDQTARMRSLIRVFAGHTCGLVGNTVPNSILINTIFCVLFLLKQLHVNICCLSPLITKTCLFKYTERLITEKLKKIRQKNSNIFHISAQNIDCGYSLEPPRRGGSNEYPQSMFLSRNKKNNVYPCKPQFYYIKVGFKGVKII